jgi:hypothetical protein
MADITGLATKTTVDLVVRIGKVIGSEDNV